MKMRAWIAACGLVVFSALTVPAAARNPKLTPDEAAGYLGSEELKRTLANAGKPFARPSEVSNSGVLVNNKTKHFTFKKEGDRHVLRTKNLALAIKEDSFELAFTREGETWEAVLTGQKPDGWNIQRTEYGFKASGNCGAELGRCALIVTAVADGIVRFEWATELDPKLLIKTKVVQEGRRKRRVPLKRLKLRVNHVGGAIFGGGERFGSPRLGNYTWSMRPNDSLGAKFRTGWTYCPVPWFFTSAGMGLFLDNAQVDHFSFFDPKSTAEEALKAFQVAMREKDRASLPKPTGLQNEHTIEAAVKDTGYHVWLFAADTPKQLVQDFTGVVGRQPLAPDWAYGVWANLNNGLENAMQSMEVLREKRVPVSGAWVFDCKEPHQDPLIGWWQWSKGVYGDVPAMNKRFQDYGVYPMGYLFTMNWHKGFRKMDALRKWRGWLKKLLIEDDWNGYMEDFGDKMYGGVPMETVLYHKASHILAEELRPGKVSFVRSGFSGTQGYTQLIWGGDQQQRWDFDGLESLIPAGLSAGLSGFGIWAPDILEGPDLELFKRWVQFAAFTCVMREHQWHFNPERQHLLATDQTMRAFRRYGRVHNEIFPYLRTAIGIASRTGIPAIRHMILEYPDDPACYEAHGQYMLGDSMLVAPVYAKGAKTKEVYFPQGLWIDYWTGEQVEVTGKVTVDAPTDIIPVFLKAGSIIPLYPETVQTLATELAGTRYETAGNRLVLRITSNCQNTEATENTFTMYDGTKITCRQEGKVLRIAIAGSPGKRRYEILLPHPVALSGIRIESGKLLLAPQCGKGHTRRLFVEGQNPAIACNEG